MRRRVDETAPSSKRTNENSTKRENVRVQARSSCWVWVKRGLIFLCTLYVASPFVLRLFPSVLQYMVYTHAVTYFVDLRHPSDLGLNHTINMYLTSEAGVTLGVWHTVPAQKWKEAQGKSLEWYEQSLGDGSPVFIYLHGNAGNRAAPHRIGVAKVLSALGYHAVVMDYRGFGDSTGEPTMPGLTTDAIYLYNWVRARSKDSLVIIWGHSLGTLVSGITAVKLQELGKPPDAVILESAFTKMNMPEDFPHPFIWYYWRFPYIQYYFNLDSIKANKFELITAENVNKMRMPLMILHSKDDHLAPFRMAEELYGIAKSVQKSEEKVRLVAFDGSKGYLHNGLYRDPALPKSLREFVEIVAE
ncbi:lysophosphatidylserine lipase ABHD12 [Clarias gariepinus]|uniref:monoacylglycerol lipase ABHD12-like n=1 Tax=Clarias gariepinus TaxID=13013 RepID=UPI00234DC39C|nr:monoacylglycerol lipase ABHD12-like [Clarias gariepinus]XP_053358187.1 monoacylglycerol lipase ABHD12-like [Clarias gariepinus]XP_053358188.1 monoacylglycerol lipase ABHD12-like [Clarias gariepinus]